MLTVQDILKGVIIGVLATVIGWLKNSKPGKFQWRGLVLKLPLGIVIGIGAAFYKVPFDDAFSWAAGLGLVEALDKITKIFVRRFFPNWLVLEDLSFEFETTPQKLSDSILLLTSRKKTLGVDDIIQATELFCAVTAKVFDIRKAEEAEIKTHFDFVFNQILQNIRKTGLSPETYENCGKLLYRLYQAWRRYKRMSEGISLEAFIKELKIISEAAEIIFNGGAAKEKTCE